MFAGVNRSNYILEFQNKTDFAGKENILGQARFCVPIIILSLLNGLVMSR